MKTDVFSYIHFLLFYILLLYRIAAMNITAEEDIEWNKLSQGWKSARSPQWLRNKWWNLKRVFHAEKPSASSMPLQGCLT